MSESVNQRLGASALDGLSVRQLRAIMAAMVVDITAVRAQLAQLIIDYNANATIATDTTAVAPTLTSVA